MKKKSSRVNRNIIYKFVVVVKFISAYQKTLYYYFITLILLLGLVVVRKEEVHATKHLI